MKRHFICILWLILMGVSVSVYSQQDNFRGLSIADGLSDLMVNEIYKDSSGYIWLGTGKALDRFDGVHIKRYELPGTDEKLKRVYAIEELSGNELWIGNGMGLWRLNRKEDKLEAIARETITGTVYALLHDGQGVMYIGTSKGLYIYRSGNLEHVTVDHNILSVANCIYALDLSPDGSLWMATEAGLWNMNLSDRKLVPFYGMQEGGHVCRLLDMERIGSMIYLATHEHGIITFDTRTHTFERYLDVGCNVISSLSGDGKKTLYVGTDGNGIHFIDTEKREIKQSVRYQTGQEGGLRSNSVYSLLVDRDGLVWIGYYQHGLDYTLFQNNLFSIYTFSDMLDTRGMPVRSIAIHGKEKLIGTREGFFYVDEQNRRFKAFKTPQLRSNMVFCSLYYQEEYYIGTYGGGMYVLNPKTLELRNFSDRGTMPFSKGHIFCIKEDTDGNMWIGTSEGVFCYRGNEQIAHYTNLNSKLPAGNVYEIFFDSTRKGWICTENGMCIWDPDSRTLRTDVFPEGFIHTKKIRIVYEDSEHKLYFCPDRGALFQSDLSMTTFSSIQSNAFLNGKDGMSLVEDSEGWLWIGTTNGLFRYDKKEHFVPCNFRDGVPDPVFTLCPPVCDDEGNLWFANSGGLLKLNFAQLKQANYNPYALMVTEVQEHGTASVTFDFSDFCYSSPESMLYEYCLEGLDDGWNILQGHSSVTYYDLDDGDFTFHVRRMGRPDTAVQKIVRISSTMGKGWFWMGFVLCLFAWVAWRIYRIRKKKEVQLPVSHEEVYEVEDKQKDKYKTNRMSMSECQHLATLLEAYMKAERPYTQPELKIGDLAKAVGTSSHRLSYMFNQYLNSSFYDYVNDYRIAAFKQMVKNNEYSQYTLGAMAELCGFSSRASFFRSFKKATGVTPNDYISSERGK